MCLRLSLSLDLRGHCSDDKLLRLLHLQRILGSHVANDGFSVGRCLSTDCWRLNHELGLSRLLPQQNLKAALRRGHNHLLTHLIENQCLWRGSHRVQVINSRHNHAIWPDRERRLGESQSTGGYRLLTVLLKQLSQRVNGYGACGYWSCQTGHN